MMKVLIDNGHGANTPGKHSPDLRLREYKWTREVSAMVVDGLKNLGIDAQLLVPETHDVSISQRALRANRWCVERGTKDVVLVSIHNNACPPDDGQWHNASYWSAWVYYEEVKKAGKVVRIKEASDNSKRLGSLFTEAARDNGWRVGVGARGNYKDANFGILRETLCPAVLTENFFQDNRNDVEFLLSDGGKRLIADLHIKVILQYIKEMENG